MRSPPLKTHSVLSYSAVIEFMKEFISDLGTKLFFIKKTYVKNVIVAQSL